MKTYIHIFLILFVLNAHAWQPVIFFQYGRWITAYLPENFEEIQAGSSSAIMTYSIIDQDRLLTAYEFPDWQSSGYGCSSQAHTYGYNQGLHSITSGLDSLALSGHQHLHRATASLELFPACHVAKHCKDFAFKKACYRQKCQYEHISKSELRDRVICFQHVLGRCKRRECVYYHLTDSQVEEALKGKEEGKNIPVIFCPQDHVSDIDKYNWVKVSY